MKISICKTIILFLGLISIIFPLKGKAQPYVDVLNLKYRYFPSNTNSENYGNNVSGNLEEATIFLPVETKKKNFFLIGGDYTALNFFSSGNLSSTYSLYSVSLPIGFDKQLKNPAWKRTVLFLPKFNGDFKGLSNSFQPGGVLMYTYKKKENLKYHFGLYYNKEFFGDYFLPLLGIDWKINSRFNLFGDLPSNLSLEMKISHAITIGTGFTTTIASYRIHSNNELSYIREGDNFLGHDEVKIYLNYYISKNFVVFGETGQTINRKYIGYDNSDKQLFSTTIPAMDGMFFTGGLAYRFEVE